MRRPFASVDLGILACFIIDARYPSGPLEEG